MAISPRPGHCWRVLVWCTLSLLPGITSAQQPERSIGWNYHAGDPLAAAERAGAPGFERTHWNNHAGQGQAPGTLPFALTDDQGAATGAAVTAWDLSANNSWQHRQTATADEKLLNHFTDKEPSITIKGIPFSSYSVVVYYGNNEGPDTSTLKVGRHTRTITTGNTARSSIGAVGYLEGTDKNTTSPSNFTVFRGVIGASLTVSLTGANNNGISAIQIVEGEPVAESTTPATPAFPPDGSIGFKPWQTLSWNVGGAGELSYEVFLWRDGEARPAAPTATVASPEFTPASYLLAGTAYRWQVLTRLESGATLTGGEFRFTTGDLSGQPPFDISKSAQDARRAEVEALAGIDDLVTDRGAGYPIPDGTTLAFFGDSITDVFTYFDVLQAALRRAESKDATFPQVTVLNRGINGATSDDLLNLPDGDQFSGGSGPQPPLPFKAQVDADLAQLADGQTYVAVIQIGINDVLQGDNTPVATYKARLEEMADHVLGKGQRVVLLSPTVIFENPIADITDDGQFDDAGNALLNDYVAALEEIADARRLSFIDQRQAYLKHYKNENFAVANDAAGSVTFPRRTGILNTDSVHPTPRGKALSSELAATGILRAFAPPSKKGAAYSPMPRSIESGSGEFELSQRLVEATLHRRLWQH